VKSQRSQRLGAKQPRREPAPPIPP
jgi:hypothetical protein